MVLKTLITAAFVTAFAAPLVAQDIADPLAPPPAANDDMADMTDEALSPAQQAEYAAWPEEVREYYDMLPPHRQSLFLQMSDADKMSLVAMPPADQEAVWQGIEALPQGDSAEPASDG